MRIADRCCVFLVLGLAGCSPSAEQPKAKNNQATADTAENVVRAVNSELLNVDSSAIPMDKPISEPPLKADDLDLVEIVMKLEERQSVEISDVAVEQYAGGKLGKGPIRITPNQLVLIVREAPKLQQSKRKK